MTTMLERIEAERIKDENAAKVPRPKSMGVLTNDIDLLQGEIRLLKGRLERIEFAEPRIHGGDMPSAEEIAKKILDAPVLPSVNDFGLGVCPTAETERVRKRRLRGINSSSRPKARG